MAKEIKKEKHNLPKITSIENITQAVEVINKDRIARYREDYSTHLNLAKLVTEKQKEAKKLFNYLEEPTNNRNWTLDYAWLDKEAYLLGWDMAERGKLEAKHFLENRMADKMKSFIAGYADRLLWQFIDQYKGPEDISPKNKPELSKLTILLKLYYEKGCKDLNNNQVKTLAEKTQIAFSSLETRWKKLHADEYTCKPFTNSVMEFQRSFDDLLKIFETTDTKAFEAVIKDYNKLKRTYPKCIE